MRPTTRSRYPGYLSLTDAARYMGVDGSVLRRNVVEGYLPATRVGGMWFVSDVVLEAFATLGRSEGRPTEYMLRRRQWVSDLMKVLALMVPAPESAAGQPATVIRKPRSRR